MDVKVKKGFAFVEFESTKRAEDAVRHLNQKKLLGRILRKVLCILQFVVIEVARDLDPEYVVQEGTVITIGISQPTRGYGQSLRFTDATTNGPLLDDENTPAKEAHIIVVMVPVKDPENEGIRDVLILETTILVPSPIENESGLHRSECLSIGYPNPTTYRSSDSRSPRPRLKLGLVERIRLREALKKHQFEDGEVLSEIEELNLNKRLKSCTPKADREVSRSPATASSSSETIKIGSIEAAPEVNSEVEEVKEKNKVIIKSPISEEEGDFTDDEPTIDRLSLQIEESTPLTDPEELKACASRSSDRELSVEV